MNLKNYFAVPLMFCLASAIAPATQAADGNWKMGRIYYQMVCTVCHKADAGGAISPSSMTKAEWAAYFEADKHAKEKDSLKYYVSQEYRDSIKDSNKAAKKLAKKPDDELLADVQAFAVHGAKDSDTPTRCQ